MHNLYSQVPFACAAANYFIRKVTDIFTVQITQLQAQFYIQFLYTQGQIVSHSLFQILILKPNFFMYSQYLQKKYFYFAYEKLKKHPQKQLRNTQIDFFPYFPEMPKWPKQEKSRSKVWLIDQLYIILGLQVMDLVCSLRAPL